MTDRKPIENRYDFTILFDVKDGNPNGDPDSGNMPRVDIETGNGLTTDVCIKRKIRDYVQTAMGEQAPWRIYIQNRQTLNRLDGEALKAEHINASLENKDFAKEIKALKKTDPELDRRLRDYMCDQFFDIRTFGAVMTTFVKGNLSCGSGAGSGAARVRPLHRSDQRSGDIHHPYRRHHGSRCRREKQHHGQQIHHPLWPLPHERLHLRQARAERHRFLR